MSSSTYTLTDKDSTNYEEGYSVFLRRSNFREKVLEKFSELAWNTFNNRREISVLDVGCGNGQMTSRYINELKKVCPILNLSLQEPAEQSLREAENLLRPIVQRLNVLSSKTDETLFDLIIASYVFYHLSPESASSIAKQIKPGGAFAIMMGTSDHPLKSHPVLKSISTHGSSDKLNPFLDELVESQNYQIDRHKIETKLNLSGLIANNVLTEEARKLLSFSLNKNFNELNESSLKAISEIFDMAFASENGNLKPVHEIIWVKRLR